MEYLIPHYGDTELVKRTVASIFVTDHTARVLVGDDTRALTDDVFSHANTIIIPGPQEGFASNVNNLVTHATGEWITILNNDVELHSDWWPQMQHCIAGQDASTFSIASTVFCKEGTIDSAGDSISWYGIGFNRYHLYQPRLRYLQPANILGATGGLTVLRRERFIQLGQYSTILQSYCEDTSLNLRAWADGYRSVYCPAPAAVHLGTSTFSPGKKYYQSARNTILYIRSNLGEPLRAHLLRRARAYWRLKALVSRRHRHEIRRGLVSGFQTAIDRFERPIGDWPQGLNVESFWQTHVRLFSQILTSIARRLGLL